MRRLAPLLITLVLCGDAAAQEGRYASSRPHSVAAIRDRDGVALTRLQARARRVGGLLEVRVALDGHLRRGTSRAVQLHVLSCTGTTDYPRCRAGSTRRVVLTRRSRSTRATARVAVPSPRTDAVVVAVSRSRFRHGSDPTTYGFLQLQGEGWRGRGAGRTYGAVVEPLAGFDVHELHFNGVGLGPREARAAVMWSVSSEQPARVRWRCTVGGCGGDVFRLRGDGHRNGEGPLDRQDIEPDGSPTMGMVGTVGDRRLFSALVPTPLR